MSLLISFEGGDGSGKSTQLRLLADYLSGLGLACVCTREPGGTNLGKMIRKALVEVGDEQLSAPSEIFLYLADRAQHVHEIVRPALASGKIVLCDRFTDSTLAYQGYGRGADLKELRRMNLIASAGVVPDLTLLLDCPVDLGLSRTARRIEAQRIPQNAEDRFEREEVEFHERVRRGFRELARAEPGRIHVLDASGPMDQVHETIKEIVERKLAENSHAV